MRPQGKTRWQLFILQGLPHVGLSRAEKMLKHFGSVEAALTASVSELEFVEGIGLKIAQKIKWAISDVKENYPKNRG